MNTFTTQVMLMIDNDQHLLTDLLDKVKSGEIAWTHQMQDHVLELFPESYRLAEEDEGYRFVSVLMHVPGLVSAALAQVDYKELLAHYQNKIEEGA